MQIILWRQLQHCKFGLSYENKMGFLMSKSRQRKAIKMEGYPYQVTIWKGMVLHGKERENRGSKRGDR